MPWLIGIGVGLLLVLILVGIYNGLVSARNQTKNSWAQIDVQLKRRYDLVPNLVETVKGAMAHERGTLEAVVKARQQAIAVQGVADKAIAEGALSGALRQLFAVAEGYPDLKANQNMLQLQEELTTTENKIGFARQAYNDSVMTYNTKCEQFPGSLFAGMFGFRLAEYFEIKDEQERKPVQVKF